MKKCIPVGLFLLVNWDWSVQISLLIQIRQLYTGESDIRDKDSDFSQKQQFEIKNT